MKQTFEILEEILLHEIEYLDNTQIKLYNNRFDIPLNNIPYIYIQVINYTVFSSETEFKKKEDQFYEIQTIRYREKIDLNILSKNPNIFSQKDDIIFSLNSMFSQQKQSEYFCRIFKVPSSFLDLSFLETSSRLFRFQLSFYVNNYNKKEKIVDYFDKFDYNIKTN